ncbi:DNA-binding MarR family transcriptional regulator [Bradyrhizobium sp. JR4.1]|uniref:hypothetical protein n=1 Tax=Bradyrhizobium sp. JR4.1 TaxID=3156372 RepID=UPI00339A699B
MGWLQDLLQEVPLSGVMRERVKLAEERYAAASEQVEILKQRVALLEKENAELRSQAPPQIQSNLKGDTARVLVQLFRADDIDDRDTRVIARALGMELSVLKYHLDRLDQAGLAQVGSANYVSGAVYWLLTPAGRQKVVEENMI